MSLALHLERSVRSARDQFFDGLVSLRPLRRAAYRYLSATEDLLFRRFEDHDLILDPADLVGATILEKGDFDRRRTNAVCQRAGSLSNRRTVLEIGANIGTQTIYFVRSGHFDSVISLEPDPRNVKLLEMNVRINGLTDQVNIIPAAAGSSPGLLTLRRDAGNSGGATLRTENLPYKVESEVTVLVVAIDDLVNRGSIDPEQIGLIWMDVEGFEEEILSAATSLLSRRTPIAFEFTPEFYDDEKRRRIIRTIFANYGEISVIEDQGFRPLTESEALALTRRVDLFCC